MQAETGHGATGHTGPNPDAISLLERFGAQMMATARRYSESPHDAEDALARATEILLTHRPTGTDEELCRWLRTTTKHEALAINRHRARVVPTGEWESVPEVPGGSPDAHDHAERLERLHHGAQAMRRLKPQEVRCLLLKAEGYSYGEICEITGFSYTKVNRCLTEGRRSFLERVTGIEAGEECERLAPQLSVLADGEAGAEDVAALRPHLETCLSCRARLRQFRAVPSRVAALAPAAAGSGQVRGMFESLLGATQDKAAAFGERAHSAAELATGQKVAAVAASAAALAGGGATVERLGERDATAVAPPAEVRKLKKEVEEQPPPPPVAAPKPVATPAPAPTARPPAPPPSRSAPAPAPAPPPPPASPAPEFAPAAAPSAAPPPPAPSAPAGGGSGEFGP